MKRFHVHVAVPDLAASIRFYSTLFGSEPAVRKDDYAKWMLDEPRLNFAISERDGRAGVNHLGFQVDSDDELEELHATLEAADREVVAEKGANCCYARSDKYWITDPAGIAWESFHTLGSIPMFGASHEEPGAATDAPLSASPGCCPAAKSQATAVAPEHAQTSCCGGNATNAASKRRAGCCA
jgi:lactoylglutathione lyase